MLPETIARNPMVGWTLAFLGAVAFTAHLWLAAGLSWGWAGLIGAVVLYGAGALLARRSARPGGLAALGLAVLGIALAAGAAGGSLGDRLARLALGLGQVALLLVGYEALRAPAAAPAAVAPSDADEPAPAGGPGRPALAVEGAPERLSAAGPAPGEPVEAGAAAPPLLHQRLATRQRESTAELRQAIRQAIEEAAEEEGKG